jgi:hypothetical protein
MTGRCAVCGGDGADILCGKCNRYVCRNCFDVGADACIKCSGLSRARRGTSARPSLLVAGFGLIMLGLMVVAWAVAPPTATFVFFPFFVGAGGTAAFLVSMIFFLFFMASTLLPVYLSIRRGGYSGWDEEMYAIRDAPLSSFHETIEYMITTEIPQGLEGSVYIEEADDGLRLLSTKDSGFVRVYDIPSDCLVDDVASDYDGGYLVLRVRLRKTH